MQTARTQELAQRAAALRETGLRLAAIAEALDISVPYASDLLRDPTGQERRERRRTGPPAPRQPGEVDPDEMARLVSEAVGFPVARNAVMAAGRRGAITSRRGPNGVPLFDGEKVLSEIDAGAWRPHRSRDEEGQSLRGQGWVTEDCANPRCTRGAHGQRAARTIRRSHHLRLADPWSCSPECTEEIGGKQRRPKRRQCGCLIDGEPCPRFLSITRHQHATDTGPRICDECKRAGRKTERQKAAARAALALTQDSDASRAHRARLAATNGQRNGRSPERMEKLIAGRMRVHDRPFTDEMRARVRGRALSRAQRTSSRSLAARETEERVRELWTGGLTADQIAEQLQAEGYGRINARLIWKIRERLGLPRRRPGRRPKNS